LRGLIARAAINTQIPNAAGRSASQLSLAANAAAAAQAIEEKALPLLAANLGRLYINPAGK
jgi:hypothetical protein